MMDDLTIQQTVTRLARPNALGGHAIERAAVLAEGGDFEAIEAWILQRGGEPETQAAAAGGLHGLRTEASNRPAGRPPVRYVLPAGALA